MTADTSGLRKRAMETAKMNEVMDARMERLRKEVAVDVRKSGRSSTRKGALWTKLKGLGLKPLTTQKTNSGRRYQRWCGEVDGDKREVVVMYENRGTIKAYVLFDHEAMIDAQSE